MSQNKRISVDDEKVTGIKPLVKQAGAPAPAVPTVTEPAAAAAPTNTGSTVTEPTVTEPTVTETPTVTHPEAGYLGNSYADWYKHYYGTDWDGSSPMAAKPDWMSTNDYTRGTLHYMYGQKYDNIMNNYGSAVGAADALYGKTVGDAAKTRNSEMAYNGVLYERMKKYMPLQQKRAGIANMGMAQTGLAQITNDHMNRRGAIQGRYDDAVGDASFARAKEVSAAEQARASSLSELNSLTAEEMMKIYADEDADAEAKQAAAITAFKDSISSYSDKDTALADLAKLGLEETDPQYTALLREIEGHFDLTQTNLDSFMDNLNRYDDPEAAKAALEGIIADTDPRFSQYVMDIEGYFEDEKESASAAAYADIEDYILNYAHDAIAAQNYLDLQGADLSDSDRNRLQTLIGEQKYGDQQANFETMEEEIAALMDDYASDDKIKAALAEWEQKVESGQLDEETFNAYRDEILAEISTEKFNLKQRETEIGDNVDYAKELDLLNAAERAGFGNDVDSYLSMIEGEIPISIAENGKYYDAYVSREATNSHIRKLNKELERRNQTSDEIPNGEVVIFDTFYFLKANGEWYLLKIDQ